MILLAFWSLLAAIALATEPDPRWFHAVPTAPPATDIPAPPNTDGQLPFVASVALPAIVDGKLVRLRDRGPSCCSDSGTIDVVMSPIGGPGKSIAWLLSNTSRQGEELVPLPQRKAVVDHLLEMLGDARRRTLRPWKNADPELNSLFAAESLEVEIGGGRSIRFDREGQVALRRGDRIVQKHRFEGMKFCREEDGTLARCLRPLYVEKGWSDSVTGIVVLRLSNDGGCDGCEAIPLDTMLVFPER
ncbi:MAG: hypothetical protein H6686_13100 [Fibrobacteria bacterium]|nr:hypothetical protein [Fibrobacteria bacterium]